MQPIPDSVINLTDVTDEELSDLMIYYAIANKKIRFEKIYKSLYGEISASELSRVFSLLRYGLTVFVGVEN